MLVCTTKLYNVFLLPPLHILFASNDCLSLFPFPCSYPRSEPHHCWSCSLLPLPRLYSLLNHPAVVNKHITHPQFMHIALFTEYISFDVINPRHARARVTVLVLSVCLSVCVFSLFWHLAQSGVQTAVSATSARYGHEIYKGIFL